MDWKAALKDWHTTIAGVLSAAASFIVFSPEYFEQWPLLLDLAKFTLVGGLATLGISAQVYRKP